MLAVLLFTGACLGGIHVLRIVPPTAISPTRIEPVLPRRDHCLKPPYWEAPDRTAQLWIGDGPRLLDYQRLARFFQANTPALMSLAGVSGSGVGACDRSDRSDGGELPAFCIDVKVDLCAQTLGELKANLAALPGLEGASVGYLIELLGNAGPGCEADDPKCVPGPYSGGKYDPTRPRGLFEPLPPTAPAFRFDGECRRGGGLVCGDWTQPWRPELAILYTSPTIDRMLCGCVEKRCQWFIQ